MAVVALALGGPAVAQEVSYGPVFTEFGPVADVPDTDFAIPEGASFHVIYSNRCFPTKAVAIWRAMDEFTAIATLDLRVDYVRPAREGASVFGRSQCYRLTRSAAFVRGLAHDGDADDPVAHIQAVFMKIAPTARL